MALTACSGSDKSPASVGVKPSAPKPVGSLRMPDVSERGAGRNAGFTPPAGGLTVVFFGYANCPDICPTTLADLGAAIGSLPAADRGRVTTAFVSVDPKRDSAKVMRGYLKHFFPDSPWLAMRTTDEKLLFKVEKAFGAAHKSEKPRPDGRYEVAHTTRSYVVSPSGEVVLEWLFGTPPEDMAADMKKLLAS